jgi:hypothetical protein
MRVIELEALDGSKWYIPAAIVQASWAAHYGETFAENEELDEDELLDWAKNDMNWSDVREHARQVKEADPCDMQESWTEGDMAVIEVDMPPSCDPVGAPATTPLGEDGPLLAVPVDMAEAERLVGVTRQAIENAAIGRYWPQACVAFRDHVHTGSDEQGELTAVEAGSSAPAVLVGATLADVEALAVPVPLDADELAALKLRLAAARDKPASALLPTELEPLGHIALLPAQVDALALSVKVGDAVTAKDYLDLYYAMREEAATILAGVQPGDHGDAILAAFGARAARMAILKAAGVSE